MTILIQFIKIQTSETLKNKTTSLANKLGKRFDWLESISISFKEGVGNTDDNKICEIEVSAPTPRLFVSVADYNYEAALKTAINDIERQLKKRKEITKTK